MFDGCWFPPERFGGGGVEGFYCSCPNFAFGCVCGEGGEPVRWRGLKGERIS